MSNISELLYQNKTHANVFKHCTTISKELNIPIYLVGGYVRDVILGKELKDIDIMAETSAEIFTNKLAKKLHVAKVIKFEKFHTYRIPYPECEIEIAACRKETYNSNSRKPSEIILTDLNGDLIRRDFTINAIAVSLSHDNFGELFDPYNGLNDLNTGIIQTPAEPNKTFIDDPLRMLRAIRFSCQLNFKLTPKTIESITKHRERIKIISWERITAEIIKILNTDKPSIGFYLLKETKLLHYVFPELDVMSGVDVVNGHSHKDVFIHTLEVVDNAANLTKKMEIRFAALVHDIAKPPTKRYYKNKGWTFHGHEELGRRMMYKIAKRMKISSELRDYLMILIKLHLRPIALAKSNITDRAVRRVMFEAGDHIDDLMILCRADITTKNKMKIKKYMNNFEKVDSLMKDVKMRDEMRQFKSPVDGHHIMKEFNLKECKIIGVIKNKIEEAILDGNIENSFDAAYQYMLSIKDEFITD